MPINLQGPGTVKQLAGRLGVERRYALRIACPPESAGLLPKIFFDGKPLFLRDISEGGCCLIDPEEVLGVSAGTEVRLTLNWPAGDVSVQGRIVSRVDNRRHIQFMDLPKDRVEAIKKSVALGGRAQSVQRSLHAVDGGPLLNAREIWNSVHGDSVVIERDVHRLAEVTIDGRRFSFFKEAWPVNEMKADLSLEELAGVCIFLCNIPNPSDLLKALTDQAGSLG